MEKSKKQYMDSQVIRQEEAKREHEEYKRHGATGAKDLMKAGSIKEAAVVFSHEGMKAFATMFANSTEVGASRALGNIEPILERVVAKVLEDTVEKMIERKMIEMLEGATQGIQEFLSGAMQVSAEKQVQGVMDGLFEEVEKQPIKPAPRKTAPKKPRRQLKKYIQGYTANDIILNILQESDKPLAPVEIGKLAKERYGRDWGNPSSPINTAMKKYPNNIVKVGFSQYMYKGEDS